MISQSIKSPYSYNAVNRVDVFAFTPQQRVSDAMTTSLAKNRGAQKHERIKHRRII